MEEVLDLLGLSMDEKFAAAAFYNKEAGEEILEQITFWDLSKASFDVVEKLTKDLVHKKRMDEIARLFLIVFARGESTCYRMFSKDHLNLIAKIQGMDLAKVTAVYSAKIGQGQEIYLSMNIRLVQSVFDITKCSTKTLLQAIHFAKHSPDNGRLILLALYLRIEYQNRKPYLLGRREKDGSPLPVTKVETEEIPLLAEHERLAVKGLAKLYFGCINEPVTEESLQKLEEELSEGKTPETLKPLLNAKPSINRFLYQLIVGLSYWNYMLSDKLKNIVKICLAIDCQRALETLYEMSSGISIDIAKKGGNYDEIFEIDTKTYLCWAAKRNLESILAKQLKSHTESYLNLMKTTDIQCSNNMLTVLKEEEEVLYKKVMQEKAQYAKQKENPDREKIIAELVKRVPNRACAEAYLRGESNVDTIYHRKRGRSKASFGLPEKWHLDDYMKFYKDEGFLRRCEAFALVNNGMLFFKDGFTERKNGEEYIIPKKVEKVWADLEEEGVGLKWQLDGVHQTYQTLRKNSREKFFQIMVKIFAGYLKERKKELVAVFWGVNSFEPLGRLFALEVLCQNAVENKKEIFAYLQDSAKPVKQKLFEILSGHREFEEDVRGLLASKKAAERELAIKVLGVWQEAGADYREEFSKALAREKSTKIQGLLDAVLGAKQTEADKGANSAECDKAKDLQEAMPPRKRADLVKVLHKGGKRRGLAWAYHMPFSVVHFMDNRMDTADSTQKQMGKKRIADEEYLQAVLLCYSSMDVCGRNKDAMYLSEILDAAEFAVYVNELFDRWMAAGAEAKKRWVLYAASIHGGNIIIEKLLRQIKEWPQQRRGAIACEAVKALSLSPMPQALLAVDGIARKFKFKQVRAAAGAALSFAASQLGITREELADRCRTAGVLIHTTGKIPN